jgi:hypothetical protein
MSDSRLDALEERVRALELKDARLGPKPEDPAERKRLTEQIVGSVRERMASIEKEPPPPTDFSARVLTDGSPVTDDHREIEPITGQQKAYVVLSGEERSKGFVRPVRHSYIHQKCGSKTTMGASIAETYAREPHFYSGTFCCNCRSHFNIGEDGEFVWEDGQKVGT